MLKTFVITVFIILLFSCNDTNLDTETTRFAEIYSANPVADAEKAINNKQYKLFGVQSHKILIPGFDLECEVPIEMILLLEGTSSFHPNYEAAKFNAIARVYAEYYNVRIKTHLEENGINICADR